MDDEDPRWASEGVVRAVLAFAGVPGILLALLLLFAFTSDFARVDALSRVLQGAMLAIIGFYFGRVGVARVEREADAARAEADAVTTAAATTSRATFDVEEHTSRAERLLQLLADDPELTAKVEELARRKGGS